MKGFEWFEMVRMGFEELVDKNNFAHKTIKIASLVRW